MHRNEHPGRPEYDCTVDRKGQFAGELHAYSLFRVRSVNDVS